MFEGNVIAPYLIDPGGKVIGRIHIDDSEFDELHDMALVPDVTLHGPGEYTITAWRLIPREQVDTRRLDDMITWSEDKKNWITKPDKE